MHHTLDAHAPLYKDNQAPLYFIPTPEVVDETREGGVGVGTLTEGAALLQVQGDEVMAAQL